MDKTQERLERALTEIRTETESRAKAEARAQASEHRIEELKIELADLRGANATPGPAPSGKKKRETKPDLG